MEQDSSKHYVKVLIPLEQDEDGYPPVSAERIWALDAGEGRYKLDNIPFFARELALGDIVSAVPEEGADEGILRYQRVIEPSGHSTFRVLVYDEARIQEVRDLLERLECGTEQSHLPRLVAIDIPPTVSLDVVRQALEPGREREQWDYEEACLSDTQAS